MLPNICVPPAYRCVHCSWFAFYPVANQSHEIAMVEKWCVSPTADRCWSDSDACRRKYCTVRPSATVLGNIDEMENDKYNIIINNYIRLWIITNWLAQYHRQEFSSFFFRQNKWFNYFNKYSVIDDMELKKMIFLSQVWM